MGMEWSQNSDFSTLPWAILRTLLENYHRGPRTSHCHRCPTPNPCSAQYHLREPSYTEQITLFTQPMAFSHSTETWPWRIWGPLLQYPLPKHTKGRLPWKAAASPAGSAPVALASQPLLAQYTHCPAMSLCLRPPF